MDSYSVIEGYSLVGGEERKLLARSFMEKEVMFMNSEIKKLELRIKKLQIRKKFIQDSYFAALKKHSK
jgi:hypothetical protein